MANDFDQFFSDEDEQGVEPEAPVKPAKPDAQARPTSQKGGIKPPTFGMAAAAAAVALLLGLAIGYAAGMYIASNSSHTSSTSATASTQTTSSASGADSASEDGELPSGHPDISQYLNADGSVNEEAVAALRSSSQAE